MSVVKNGDILEHTGKYFEDATNPDYLYYLALMYKLGCVLNITVETDGSVWVKNLGNNPSIEDLNSVFAPDM